MNRPSGLETMKRSLNKVQQRQADCLDEYNIVKSGRRNEYSDLIRQARKIKQSIETWDKLMA